MNGIVEITINDHKHQLSFGVQSCMIFQDLAVKNAMDPTSKANEVKLIGDLFYSGLVGHALRNQKPAPTYAQAMDLFDLFSCEPTFIEENATIWGTWRQSKWGSDLIAVGSESLKKKAETEENLV